MGKIGADGVKSRQWDIRKISEYYIAFIAVLVLFLVFWLTGLKNNMDTAASGMIICEAATAAYAVRLLKSNKLDSDKIVRLVFLAGMIMGVGNMLGTSIFDKGYDQGYVSENACGHFGYILKLIMQGHLPDTNAEQCYQPPLFHFVSSIFVRLGLALTGGDADKAIEFTQISVCSVYCFTMIAAKNFLSEIDMDAKYRPYAAAVIAFHPVFFLMGLRGNNDMFAAFFTMLCVINTFRWYRTRAMKEIVCLALSFGFGMMSKISVGVMALFTGVVMVYCAVKDFRRGEYKETIKQFAVFALICLPLAMWYPIRNHVLFGQEFNYVQRLSENIPIYIGDVPWYKRFFGFSLSELIEKPYYLYDTSLRHPEGTSIPMHMLKTSLFAAYSIKDNSLMCLMIMLANIVTVITAVVSAIYVVWKGDLKKRFRYGFAAIWVLVMAFFVQFNISYKYSCTADFRYIPITAVTGALFIGYALQTVKNDKTRKFIKCAVWAFALCSAGLYI